MIFLKFKIATFPPLFLTDDSNYYEERKIKLLINIDI